MGERHQLFIIANRGGKYRCLAVAHHQWLYGKTALQRCLRLLRIFADPSNRIAIEQELTFSVIENEKTEANSKGIYKGAPHPFPFIATCLYLGSVADPEAGRLSSRAYTETPSMAYNKGDNNTGITVVDITDLDHLRYCFIWFERSQNDEPETAGKYLRRFYDIDEQPHLLEDEYKGVLETLEKYDLIPLESLQACWPRGRWSSGEEELGQPTLEKDQPHETKSRSLLDMSMKKLLDELLSSGEDADISLLDHTLEIPSMKDALIEYVRQNPDKLAASSTVAVKVLTVLLDGKTYVDLSPYHQMTPGAIRSLLSGLNDVRILNLSGTLAASDNEIVDTLATVDHDLDELYILGRPDRDVDNPAPAIRAVGKRPYKCHRIVLGSALSKSVTEYTWWMGPDGESKMKPIGGDSSSDLFGLWTSFPVIQIVLKGPSMFHPMACESYFLGDALLSPIRFVSGLLNAVRGKIAETWMEKNGSCIAHGFATAAPSMKSWESVEVNAPPAETLWFGKRCEGNSLYDGVHCRVRDLAPDTWTAILVQESRAGPVSNDGTPRANIRWFKIALLRTKQMIPATQGQKVALEDVEVVDVETFLAKYSTDRVPDLHLAIKALEEFADLIRPGRNPEEDVIRPLDATEAVGVMEELFGKLDTVEELRTRAFQYD